MSELEKRILEVLNRPGKVGKCCSVSEIIRELCYIAGAEKQKDYVAFSVSKGGSIRLLGNCKKEFMLSDNIKEKLKDVEFMIGLTRDIDNDKFEIYDVESVCCFDEVIKALADLEEKGLAYKVNEDYRSFPKDKGYVQGNVYFDEKNNGIVYDDNGSYFINGFNLAGVLDGDLVVVSPCNQKMGDHTVAKIDKVIKRKDGLLEATVVVKNGRKQIKADNKIFNCSLYVNNEELENYQDGDKVLVCVDIPNGTRVTARIIKKIDKAQEDTVVKDEERPIEQSNSGEELIVINVLAVDDIKALIISHISQNKTRTYSYNDIYKNVQRRSKGKAFKKSSFEQALNKLQEDGFITLTNKNLYKILNKNTGYVCSKIKINKFKDGLLEGEDGIKYLVHTDDLMDALDGDLVLIKVQDEIKEGRVVSKVEKIIKRKDGLVVVEVSKDAYGEYYLRPFNAYLTHPIKVNNYFMKPLVEGDRILVKLDEVKSDGIYYADFIKSIGHKDDPDADLKVIAIQNDIIVDFSDEALKEAENIPTEVLPSERDGRLDLRDKVIFSIDGASTKDRDDAISIEVLPNGNYQVGVHISDVSHYVHPGMKLWDEAMLRGTSVYMIDTVIPMIPHKLSNGICSLNEGVDRLAFSCIMEINKKGQIVKYDFVDTIINSKKAMTYEDVNQIFEEDTMVPGYEEFYDDLSLMDDLSRKLEDIKEKRGYVNFGTNDLVITRDENGKPLEFKKRQQRTAEKIIENLMLLAGECYANYMVIPTPLRVHEKPDEDKVEEAFDLLEKSGIRVKSVNDIVNGKVIQQILSQIDNMDEREIAANILLRSMKRARYDVNDIGHFGLGLSMYGHWTSPIRRAADLRGHYNLRIQRDHIGYIKDYEKFTKEMAKLCFHISKMERNADQAERDADEYEMTKYVLGHIGEKFECQVTYISPKVIFVKTVDGIDGKIYLENIMGDTFRYNESTYAFIGRKSKKRIKLGSHLVVTAIEADQEFGSVAFGIAEDDIKLIKGRKKGA